MFPHQNNIRERRVGQPPMAPQHLMGMPQQGPGVLMSMPQQMQIMTQNHYTNQNSYATQGQGNVSAYVTPQQIPAHKSNYHQTGYTHNNQVIITKHTMSRNKNYRKDYNVIKDSVNYNLSNHNNHQNTFRNNEYNSTPFSGYSQGNYNGHYSAPALKDNISKNNNNHDIPNSIKEKEESVKKVLNKVENSQECPAIPKNLVYGGKEKTPMCLINELARYNKIIHQYRLTNEQGPAHKKSFTVTLTLGTEEYTADGPSIKKAQHSAAAEALSKTSFSHPAPKTNKNMHSGKSNITPTVELNALAMKRGEPAIYKLLEPTHNQQIYQAQSSFAFRRTYGVRGFGKRGRNNFFSRGGRMHMRSFMQNLSYTVSLKVGCWEFFGEGISPQSARHDAASKALNQLRMMPIPEENTCPALKSNAVNTNQEFESGIKSPISLVHEIALKRNLNVAFEVISERGPPHMKIFVTKCTVGDVSATGQGNGKKTSKKRAAENILVELKKLPSISPSFGLGSSNLTRMKRKFPQAKKKSRNVIKIVQEHKIESEFGEDVNPISRLIQIQQLKKEKEPTYVLLEERGNPRKKEFVMEVSAGQLKATGTGPNKKLAKKAAAQILLNQMGYGKPDSLVKPTTKILESSQDISKEKKATFVDNEKGTQNNTGGSAGRQLKPGIYVMSCDQHCSSANSHITPVNLQTTATIARELLKGGNSPTADALLLKSSTTTKSTSQSKAHSFRPKDQLLYLAELLNFEIHFSDFPKGSHSEYLSLVTMSTDPSHVCHGSGASIEESQDQAALTALTALSEMGLDSITNKNSTKDNIKKGGNGKGMPQIKK